MPSDSTREPLPAPLQGEAGFSGDRPLLRDLLVSFERNIIVTAMFAAGGDQRRAASALGLLPATLQEKLRRFGLKNTRPERRARGGERGVVHGDRIKASQ